MVEQNRHILVTHPIERYRAMNIWIVTAYNMACRYINHFAVYVCKQRLDAAVDNTDRGPTRKEDGTLMLS